MNPQQVFATLIVLLLVLTVLAVYCLLALKEIFAIRNALNVLRTSVSFIHATSNARFHPGYGEQLDATDKAIADLEYLLSIHKGKRK